MDGGAEVVPHRAAREAWFRGFRGISSHAIVASLALRSYCYILLRIMVALWAAKVSWYSSFPRIQRKQESQGGLPHHKMLFDPHVLRHELLSSRETL